MCFFIPCPQEKVCTTSHAQYGNNWGLFQRTRPGTGQLCVDDALDRKLGGGSTFYGERKSNFSKSPQSYKAASQQAASEREEARMKLSPPNPFKIRQGGQLSGEQLRNIIVNKWGERFPVLIKRRRDALGDQRLYLVIQWKRLGKRNLNLTEQEFVAESDAVAELLSEWGVANMVQNAIQESTARPKTMTQQYPGLFVPLEVDREIVDTW